jgi:hypothetical protein
MSMNRKLRINNKIIIGSCGGIMLGVSVPVIIAAWGKSVPLFFGVMMLVVGLSLVCIISKPLMTLKKALLAIHALIAAVILIGTTVYNPHVFLICWSILVILLVGFGWFGLRNEQKI